MVQTKQLDWQPIETYPRCKCDGGWGPKALLRVAGLHGPYECVAHLEAGMWIYIDPEDDVACGEIFNPVLSWVDIGYAFREWDTGEIMDPYPCPDGIVRGGIPGH